MRLTDFEKHQLKAIFSVILPSGGKLLPLGAKEVDCIAHVTDFLPRIPFRNAIGVRLMFLALALAPFWKLGRWRTFAALTVEEGTELLERMLKSRNYFVRQVVFLVREMACMAFGGEARVQTAIERAVKNGRRADA